MDSTENIPPLIGLRDLVDYGSYMSRLIGLEGSSPSPSPSPSPCHSDQGSPTARKKVRYIGGSMVFQYEDFILPHTALVKSTTLHTVSANQLTILGS